MKNIRSHFYSAFVTIFVLQIVASATTSTVFAQNTHFLEKGRIYYEKEVNQHALYRSNSSSMVQMNMSLNDLLKNIPQFQTTHFYLDFGQNKSLYQVDEDKKEGQSSSMRFHLSGSGVQSSVFKDYNTNEINQIRSFAGETVSIQDSLPPIVWRIMDEYREIAGYSCRRANGLIMDSVYVVAFYADQLAFPGGPESFGGLPGTILGLALPDYNTTWFATKVEYQESTTVTAPPIPKRALTFTRESFLDRFNSLFGGGLGSKSVLGMLF